MEKVFIFLAFFGSSWCSKRCKISQYSSDGFGHQVEGKFSCLMSDYLHDGLQYVHIPFDQMQHTPELIEKAEKFTNIGYGCVLESDLWPSSTHSHNPHRKVVDPAWLRDIVYGNHSCDPNLLYVMDNCWEMSYKPPYAGQLVSVSSKLRKKYFMTPKPATRFNSTRKNVVVHIRRGDARARYMPLEYYRAAIEYYLGLFHSPVFWIVSDDPRWPGHRKLKTQILSSFNPSLKNTTARLSLPVIDKYNLNFTQIVIRPADIHLPRVGDSLFLTFHRMVLADGLVLSRSSLSSAAAILSNASSIVASSKHVRTPRESW